MMAKQQRKKFFEGTILLILAVTLNLPDTLHAAKPFYDDAR
jgi:hypothetical protein